MTHRPDDAWFELLPQALIEFDEQAHILRSNAMARQMLGAGVDPGQTLDGADTALQTLTGWDAPDELRALPIGQRLKRQTAWADQAASTQTFGSEVLATSPEAGTGRRFLCVVQPSPSSRGAQTDREQGELLHELQTIMESSPAGTAYVRGSVVVRCNRRFERMLGFTPGALPGRHIDTLLRSDPRIHQVVTQSAQELLKSGQFETEIEVVVPLQPTRWYALSMRRVGDDPLRLDMIAVLSDISRLRSQQVQLERLVRDRDLMFSLSGVGIAFVREGLIQSANPALAHLLGLGELALVGRPLLACYLTGDDQQSDADVLALLHQQGHWQGERALCGARGATLWAEVNLRLVNPRRPEEGHIASFVNVHERHQARQELALQAERTRAILDSVFVGIVTLDEKGIVWMNRSARRMFGGELDSFLGQPLSVVAPPDLDHPFRLTDYLDELGDGQAHTFECEVIGRDGRVFWVVGNAVVTLDESNKRQVTYALLDIDRRREAEARTVEAQATLQRIIEMAPMAIALCDAASLRIVQANQAASEFLQTDAHSAIGLQLDQLHQPERAQQMRADVLAALDAGVTIQREYRTSNGLTGVQIWSVNYQPLSHEEGAAEQILLVASDITEQRAAEQARLDAAIAQREMLVKEVHHRIKNNLQGVAGLLQQIAARKPEVAEPISEVVGQVQAIAQVYGLQVGAGGPLRLKNVVESITASVQRTFGRNIHLDIQGSMAADWLLPEAESIPIALSLNELLTNAHKHGPGEAPLRCQMACTAEAVTIDIHNPGRLPEGFNMAQVRGGVSGLGLVRALLPRRSSTCSLTQTEESVLTRIKLTPPGVLLSTPPPLMGESTGQQTSLWPQ